MTTTEVPATGFARVRQILPLLGISKTTFWKAVRKGQFPAPVASSPFGPAVTVWHWDQIHAFIRGEWSPQEGSQ